MTSPAVSVIIPCYRAAATLGAAVRSVQAQSCGAFELLIVDDGSPDHSLDVARSLAAEDDRIIILSQPNAGPAAARNTGISTARAPILAFLDADDVWSPNYLARHLAHFAQVPACGISFARISFCDAGLAPGGRVSAYVNQLHLAAILGENAVCTTSNLTVRRAVFDACGVFDTTLTHGEDQEFVARVLAATAWQVRGLDDVLVRYRMSPSGLSADLARMRQGWAAMLECVRAYAPEAVFAAQAESSAIFHRYLARRALRTGQPAHALAPMLRAWRESPRALLTRQPARTVLTTFGVLAAQFPGNPMGGLLAR